MKANEFVKKYGITKASKLVVGYPKAVEYKFYNYDFEKEHGKHDEVCLVDLKRLVESYELVGRYGTADEAKEYLPMLRMGSYDELKQAIVDVESCL